MGKFVCYAIGPLSTCSVLDRARIMRSICFRQVPRLKATEAEPEVRVVDSGFYLNIFRCAAALINDPFTQ